MFHPTLIPALMGVLLLLAVPRYSVQGNETTHSRETITAVLLWKFALFTEWPVQPPATKQDSFHIGILGKNRTIGTAMMPYTRKEIKARKVRINYYSSGKDVKNVHLLFIPPDARLGEKERRRLIREGTLLCSTRKGFAANGGMVELILESGKNPQFEINQGTVKEANLEIRARVVAMARTVYPANQEQAP